MVLDVGSRLARMSLRQFVVALLLVVTVPLAAEQRQSEQRVAGPGETQFNIQLLRPSGGPVIPIFEGWFQHPDGSYELSFGYFNVNTEEVLDIPLGPDNFIEPGQYDGAQPTHFLPVPDGDRRHWGVFTVRVPADFGARDVVWTLRIDGRTFSVPGRVTRPPYQLHGWIFPGDSTASPLLSLERGGAQGPRALGCDRRTGRDTGWPAAAAHGLDDPGRALSQRLQTDQPAVVQASGDGRGDVQQTGVRDRRSGMDGGRYRVGNDGGDVQRAWHLCFEGPGVQYDSRVRVPVLLDERVHPRHRHGIEG